MLEDTSTEVNKEMVEILKKELDYPNKNAFVFLNLRLSANKQSWGDGSKLKWKNFEKGEKSDEHDNCVGLMIKTGLWKKRSCQLEKTSDYLDSSAACEIPMSDSQEETEGKVKRKRQREEEKSKGKEENKKEIDREIKQMNEVENKMKGLHGMTKHEKQKKKEQKKKKNKKKKRKKNQKMKEGKQEKKGHMELKNDVPEKPTDLDSEKNEGQLEEEGEDATSDEDEDEDEIPAQETIDQNLVNATEPVEEEHSVAAFDWTLIIIVMAVVVIVLILIFSGFKYKNSNYRSRKNFRQDETQRFERSRDYNK